LDALSSKLLGPPVGEKTLLDRARKEQRDVIMLWTIFVVLVILWLLGFSLHVGGGLIHLLLVVGLVVLVINLLSGRQTAV
jgi:fatty acid desaturase